MGEVVFNTSMSGYQEILTDPSYRGQLVTMTSTHIGNYGVNELDVESERVQVAGFIVREASPHASNYRATATLDEYLKENKTVGITGVDTRAVTRTIRDAGAVMGAIVSGATLADVPAIVERIAAAPPYDELDYVAEVSVKARRRVFFDETGDEYAPFQVRLGSPEEPWPAGTEDWPEVAVIDYGVKRSILEHLANTNVRVSLYPHTTTAEELDRQNPDGILLSNGPGDPALLDDAVERIQGMLGKRPLFGICLGHQLLARAVGGETFKLKFGHRGPNQPVLDRETGRVQITSQNHGYAVDAESLDESIEVTHTNLNDQTVEGMKIPAKRAFSVQHHPEAGPGPHDALVMFEEFRRELAE